MLPKQIMKKALVTFAIENALIEVGDLKLLAKITDELHSKSDCIIEDCFDSPQNLVHVLDSIPLKTRSLIKRSITKNLEDFSYQEPVKRFMTMLDGDAV